MLYQIRERKRIPEASLFYTQKFIFTQNLTRLKILLPLRLLYLFRDFLLTFSLAVRPDGKRSAYKISKIDTCVLLVILSYF